MATKKKNPTPERCTCGRIPLLSKPQGRGWVVACPNGRDCDNHTTPWPTEAQAVEAWNVLNKELLYKEAQK